MKFILRIIDYIISALFGQISGTQHFWKYEPDKRHISITNKCRDQLKDLGISESYAFDVYYYGMKTGTNRMVKKYNGYQISILYMIAPDTGRVVITWVGKKEIR